jgi:ATP-dependent DNA helicase DinG
LEDAAAKHLGLSVGRKGVARLLGRLERRGRGLLSTLRARFALPTSTVEAASFDLVESRLSPSVDAARRISGELFDQLERHVRQAGTPTVRITAGFNKDAIWKGGLENSLDDLIGEFTLMADALGRIRERLVVAEAGESDLPVLSELRGVTRRLNAAGDALQATLRPAPNSAPSVRWLESKGRDPSVVATTVPLDLSSVLRDDLFRKMKTAIVTSATLSVGGSFDFVRERLGLTEPDVEPHTRVFPSSFHFEDQALLAVPADFASPSEKPEEHRECAITAVKRMVELADGGIFVLCTSHRDVKQISTALRNAGLAARFPMLVQGEEDSRDILLRRFRESGRAILLGTSSFWEGVDVRGSALRGIVVVRLPFKVPTEPMTAAHCEAIAARGGDPFDTYLLPLAALRLKQGFGRLIRSATDWGAVVVADSRLAKMRYGESIIESLPPAQRCVAPWSEVSMALQKFYEQRRRET